MGRDWHELLSETDQRAVAGLSLFFTCSPRPPLLTNKLICDSLSDKLPMFLFKKDIYDLISKPRIS